MGKILATPAARVAAAKGNVDLSVIKGSGEYGSIRLSDVLNAANSDAVKAIKATPVAKSMAAYYNTDLSLITAQGNKITKNDVLSHVNGASTQSVASETSVVVNKEVTTRKLAGMRKTISDNMMNSLNSMAQFTQMAEIDTTDLIKLFKEAKQTYAKFTDEKLTVTDLFIKLVSLALVKSPVLNQTVNGDTITTYPYVNMGLAVSLEEGLIVPTIENTDSLSLFDISKKRKEIVGKARDNKLKPAEYTGGTFTISNIGNGPGTYFTPVINPPQVAILGIGKTEEKPVVRDGEIVVRTITYFSLTMDHRIVDGMEGIKFLKVLEELIANPMSILL